MRHLSGFCVEMASDIDSKGHVSACVVALHKPMPIMGSAVHVGVHRVLVGGGQYVTQGMYCLIGVFAQLPTAMLYTIWTLMEPSYYIYPATGLETTSVRVWLVLFVKNSVNSGK